MRALLVLFVFATTAISAGNSSPSQTTAPRVIEMTAERFEFWPSEVTMTEGETVEFRIRSEDTIHGFRLVGTSTSLIVPKRGKGSAVATVGGLKPGRYTFECSRMCGAGHHFMRGVLVVTPATGGTQ